MNERMERLFPALRGVPYEITSPATPGYNCIAWAAGDDSRWWEPAEPPSSYYWPEGVSRRYTLEAYAEAFRHLGFEDCENARLEQGWEKVAIYAKEDGRPTHAARQLANGDWTSKLGGLEDISHPEPDHVSGTAYGRPVLFLRRRRAGYTPTTNQEETNP